MWPFGRTRHKTGATGAQPAPAPVVRRDWAALPPIQRTFGGHPLTAPSDRFSDDLATHHDPSVTTERMGHQVSAEAPAGIVLSLAVPSTRSDGPAMIARPRVQRHADSAPAESGEWTGDEAAPIEARPTPVPQSLQRSPAVERPAVAALAEHPPLTTVATEPTPVASVPIQRRSIATPSTEWFAPAPTVAADPPASAGRPRLTLGESPRLWLGAPLSKMPDHSVQRSVDEAAPLALAPSTPAQEPAETSRAMPASSDRPLSAASTETASAPQAAIQRAAVDRSAPLLGAPLPHQR